MAPPDRQAPDSKSFHRWMRKIGINFFMLIIFCVSWLIYSDLIVTPVSPNLFHLPSLLELINDEKPFRNFWKYLGQELGLFEFSSDVLEKYGYPATIWLFTVRMYSLVHSVTIAKLCSMLTSTPPPLDDGLERKKLWTKKTKTLVHCVCVRIVTRGDLNARPLLRKAVTAAIGLFNEMCLCEKLKAHVVTQAKFLDNATMQKWFELGATEVKEIVVPPEYKTPNGTLYKARNICYWEERGGVGLDCDEDRSWILSLDEEAVITKSLVDAFIDDVLSQNGKIQIGIAVSPATIDVQTTPVTFMTKVMEAAFVATHYSFLHSTMASKSQGTLCFHGGAFLIRASIERQIGNDWGPRVSVAEDYATGVVANDKKIPFKYLDGWFVEGAAPNLIGYIQQRARFFRGQVYATKDMPMDSYQKLLQILRLTILATYPFLQLGFVSVLFIVPGLTPAGPRCFFLDAFLMFSMSIYCAAFIFGASYMNTSNGELVAVILLSPVVVYILRPIIDAAMILSSIWSLYTDWKTGVVAFKVTTKMG